VLILINWILFLPLFAKKFKKIFDFVLEFADNFCCLTDDDDPQFKELFPLNEHSALPRQKSARRGGKLLHPRLSYLFLSISSS